MEFFGSSLEGLFIGHFFDLISGLLFGVVSIRNSNLISTEPKWFNVLLCFDNARFGGRVLRFAVYLFELPSSWANGVECGLVQKGKKGGGRGRFITGSGHFSRYQRRLRLRMN